MDPEALERAMSASHLQTLRAMAYNNAWSNHRLLSACIVLTRSEFEAPRTGFFPLDPGDTEPHSHH